MTARFGNTAMLEGAERVAYHRSLYRRSDAHRLARINHSRRQRGAPEIASLAETHLRIPVSDDEIAIGISGYGEDGAPY